MAFEEDQELFILFHLERRAGKRKGRLEADMRRNYSSGASDGLSRKISITSP